MINAIKEAEKCTIDVPIGCVIKLNGEIIASAHNMREVIDDVTAHAEILAIKEAQNKLKSSRLTNCEMYVTLEPCPMCAWVIIQSGIKTLYYGSSNPQYGAIESVINLTKLANSRLKVYSGIEEERCNKLLDDFFTELRKNDNKNRA